MESPFEVLQIDPDADEGEIEDAYKRRVKEAHPDQGGSIRQFRLVKQAYEQLTSENGPTENHTEGDRGEESGHRRPNPRTRRTENERYGRAGSNDESTSGSRPENPRVEYLNYEVLDDHGWDLKDDDLFEKATSEGLDPSDYGRIAVQGDESLLEAAENRGFTWPYSCRGGACANCAVAVTDGDLSMPASHVLPEELLDEGIRLSCMGEPTTDGTKVVYNVKHMPDLEELLLPPGPFKRAQD
jgi:ferredoxin